MTNWIVREVGIEWVALAGLGVGLILLGLGLVHIGREHRRPATYAEVYDTGEIPGYSLPPLSVQPPQRFHLASDWRRTMEAEGEIEQRGARTGRHRDDRVGERTRPMPEDLWGGEYR